MPSRDIEEKSYARFDGCRLYSCNEILRVGLKNDKVTRARNIGQGY